MQVSRPTAANATNFGVIHTTKVIWGRYGFFGMWRGIKAVAIGAGKFYT
jgi:hypothetical protein